MVNREFNSKIDDITVLFTGNIGRERPLTNENK